MTLVEHLGELRRRLAISVAAVALATIVTFAAYHPILRVLVRPLCEVQHNPNCKLIALSPLDQFTIRLKIAGYGGVALAAPVWFWELWRFITPGLRPRERRFVLPCVAASVLLFFAGALLAYYTYPHALGFFQAVGGHTIQSTYTADQYMNLLLALMGIFGAVFELPVILVGLELVGVLRPEQLAKARRWAIVGITIAGAVLTPSSDPFSMFAMVVPLYVFYEGSIVVGRLVRRNRRRREARAGRDTAAGAPASPASPAPPPPASPAPST